MASLVHGSVGPFDSSQEDWHFYTERLEQYFAANNVAGAEKQRAILISACDASTYQLIQNLVAQDQPKDRSFDELVKLVEDHHQPPPSAIVQLFNFHSRSRRQGETVSEFVAALRKLTEYCQFGDTLSDMLWDRLVCGINDQKLQCRLLAEPTLTYEKAFALAQALETADKSTKELEKASGVHLMQPHPLPQDLNDRAKCATAAVEQITPSPLADSKTATVPTVGKGSISLKSAGAAATTAHALSEDAASLCSRNPSRLTSSTKSHPKMQYTRFSM